MLCITPAVRDRPLQASQYSVGTMTTAKQLAQGEPALLTAVERSNKLLNRRALAAAAASAVPIPGIDWVVDAALLSRLLPAINAEFGLTPAQLDQLPPHKREQVQKAVGVVGSMLIGKLITKDVVMAAAKHIGLRLTIKQATKYVPVAGQAISAFIGYMAIRYLGEEHIKDCVSVAKAAGLLQLPPPSVNKNRIKVISSN
jgi:hypothetical protein